MRIRAISFLIGLSLIPQARAENPRDFQLLRGTIEFTETERANHGREISKIIDATLASAARQRQEQEEWFRHCGIGTLYGWLSPFSKLSKAARQSYLDDHAKCARAPETSAMLVTSCERFTNRHLAQGFSAVGAAATYAKINTYLNANDRSGLSLLLALRKLGWKTLYWNTDVTTEPPLPKDRKIVGVTPNDHVIDTRIAMKQGKYYGVPVDSVMVNFAPNPGSSVSKDETILAKLRRIPYFIGVSHAGFHVWHGSYGEVTESHSYYDPSDARNVQVGLFDPPRASPACRDIEVEGRMQTWCYYSGLIAIPPGPWLWF